MKLKEKGAILAGPGSGTGRAIACFYAEKGSKIVVSANLNITGGEETLRNIKEKGGDGI